MGSFCIRNSCDIWGVASDRSVAERLFDWGKNTPANIAHDGDNGLFFEIPSAGIQGEGGSGILE